MKTFFLALVGVAFLTAACGPAEQSLRLPPEESSAPEERPESQSNTEDRKTFAEVRASRPATKLIRKEKTRLPVPEPAPGTFDLVQYESPLGTMDAYIGLNPSPGTSTRHPAIIWIVGGFENSIDENAWLPAPRDDDQSASAFREAGIVTMFPSLRGGNENPGYHEGLLGEVDDVLAAAKHLATVDYVDPDRIYLGGHSVGGTLALLVAAADSENFRAVFSFGPIAFIQAYPQEYLTFDARDDDERMMRSPIYWLQDLACPTFIFEGSNGNIEHLEAMRNMNRDPSVKRNREIRFYAVDSVDHFSILRPVSELLAEKILADTDSGSAIEISADEVSASISK